jgi:hypothetical protein
MALAKPTVARNQVETEVEAVETQAVQDIAQETAVQDIAPVETPVTQEPKTTQVAVKREATHPVASASNFTAAMAEQGFEGLKLDGFSFPTIVLPGEGFFQLSDDEDSNLGKIFVFTPESSRSRFIVKESDDKDAENYMSYVADGSTKTDGTDATAILRQWAADSGDENYRPVIKQYLDLVATVIEADPSSEQAQDLVGETVMVSIPPTSISRFSGAFARGLKRGGIGEFDIEASVGRKVKTDGGGFYPWQFKLV